MVAYWFEQETYVCEECNNLQDPKSIFMITDFKIFPITLFRYWILVHRRFNNFLYVYCKEKSPLFFICRLYCCLVKEGWILKVAQQFSIRGLVAYKLIAYKKPSVSKRLSAKVYTLSPFYFTSLQKQSPVLFYKKVVLKYFAIITEKHLFWGFFLIKLQAFSPETLLKRNSNTAAFLWILRHF